MRSEQKRKNGTHNQWRVDPQESCSPPSDATELQKPVAGKESGGLPQLRPQGPSFAAELVMMACISAAVGRSCTLLERQAQMRSAISWGASSGTLRGRRKRFVMVSPVQSSQMTEPSPYTSALVVHAPPSICSGEAHHLEAPLLSARSSGTHQGRGGEEGSGRQGKGREGQQPDMDVHSWCLRIEWEGGGAHWQSPCPW